MIKKTWMFVLLIILSSAYIVYTSDQKTKDWPVLKGPYLGQKTPGLTPEIFAPGIISTLQKYELNSVFTPDGEEFYFCVSASTPEEKAQGIYHYELWFTKMVDDIWSRPRQLKLAGKYSVADVALSPDGNRLYICSDMPSISKDGEGFDIWYVTRTKNGWSKPVNPGKNINTPFGETQPSFLTDGTMFFPSRPQGPDDPGDIFYSKFINGKFQKPVILPDTINTQYGEGNSFVAPDESYIIFARWGMPKSIDGGKGMYISFKRKDGSWTKARNTKPVTSLAGSLAALSPDGKYLFYSSAARSKQGDIYWVDVRILDKLKPKDL